MRATKSMRITTGVLVTAMLLVSLSASAAVKPSFTAPQRLGFKAGDDWEPAIAADRHGHVYALWTHYGNDPACSGCASPHTELQISSDSGATWSKPRPLAPSSERQDDPQIVVDPVDGTTVYASFMQGDKSSQYVAKSTDFGRTWKKKLVENLKRGTDKDILAVRGKDVYLVYNAVMKIYASVSHNGGRTWKQYQISTPTTNSKLGWSLPSGGAIDSKGNAYFAWGGYEQSGKPSGDVNLFISKTTNGGRTWSTSVVAVSQAPPPCDCGGWAFWGEQMALAIDDSDVLYVLYNSNHVPFGVNQLHFARSTDGARTWTGRSQPSLAPAAANNLFPAIAARGHGDVRIAWQDDRNGFDSGGDDPSARWNTYYRESSTAGRTWSPEVQLSQFVAGYPYKFRQPREGYLQPYGDYFEIDIDGAGRTHALWGEGASYAGPGNVWYAHSVR
jgi:BNR repeat-like domain